MLSADQSTFFKFLSDKSANARKSLQFTTHAYRECNPTSENYYQVFQCPRQSDRILIYVHGGMWRFLDLASSSFLAEYFVGNGFHFIAVGYDTCPSVGIMEIIAQVRQAIKSILLAYPNETNVYLLGHSAGSHLILSAMVCDWLPIHTMFSREEKQRLAGLVLISGTYDLNEIRRSSMNEIFNLTADEAIKSSPINYVSNLSDLRKDFLVLILVEENDSHDFHNQSKNLYHGLKPFVNESCLHFVMIEDVNHFTVISRLGDADFILTDLIINYLS